MKMDDDIKRPSFWISNVFILMATVIGVYLAASQGFEQAVQFDTLRADKSNYYMRVSLRNELASNVEHMKEYIDKVAKRIDKPELVLDTFVWNSMTYSPSALETPSALLREAQAFYRRAPEIMNTPYFNNQNKASNLGELIKHVEENVLPAFDADTDALRKSLKDRDQEV